MEINNYQTTTKRAPIMAGENTASSTQQKKQEATTLPQVSSVAPAKEDKKAKKFKLPVLLTTIAGTILPILVIRKYQGKTLQSGCFKGLDFKSKAKAVLKSFNIEYGLKEMLFASFGSTLGGLSGGLLFDKKENKKAKIKESVFQLSNIAIPTSIIAGLLKLTEKCKNPKAILPKVAAVVAGIATGMPLATIASNKINNTIMDKDNQAKRKLRLKDCFVHIDDLVGALILTKIPFADKLHADKILPALYGICGYEAGTKQQK